MVSARFQIQSPPLYCSLIPGGSLSHVTLAQGVERISATTASRLTRGRPRQFCVICEKSRLMDVNYFCLQK